VPNGVAVPAVPHERVPKPTVSCLAVGRMVGRKSPILLLDAFRRASESCPALTLDVVGAGPLLAAALQFVRAFGLESRVTMHGALPESAVQQLMRRADMFLQHSVVGVNGDEEGLPNAVLEAMAAGLPVVSTRHAGIPEAVEDGVSGYLVSERDTVRMAERIVTLAADAGLRTSMGRAGWHYARTFHSWNDERSRICQVLGLDGGPVVPLRRASVGSPSVVSGGR
jgi:colanic acid/amylovoran biosynthesis glycosyltransferase